MLRLFRTNLVVGLTIFAIAGAVSPIRAQVVPTSTTLQTSPNPSTYGQSVTLTATVTNNASGRATFFQGATVLGVALVTAGTGSLTVNSLPPGTYNLTALFTDDGTFGSSVSPPIIQTVATVSSALLSAPTGTLVGQAQPSQPMAIAVGNFNLLSSGLAVVTGNAVDKSVSVLYGFAGGTFAGQVVFPIGHPVVGVALADFNGDGLLDIAAASGDDGQVYFEISNVDGGFKQSSVAAGVNLTAIISSADFNGDGVVDLAVAAGDGIHIVKNMGDGTFSPGFTFAPAGFAPTSLVAGDFNGDGFPDLAATSGGFVYVLLGNPTGSLTASPSFAAGVNPTALAIGDFNGDGLADLAVVDSSRTDDNVIVLEGNGDGTFSPFAPCLITGPGCPSAGVNASAIAVTDFTNDGVADLVVANAASNSVTVLLGVGDGTFQTGISFPTGLGPVAVTIGDLNGDGRPDVLTADKFGNDVSVLTGSQESSETVLSASAQTVAIGASVNLAASISGVTGTPLSPATGTVTFEDGGVPVLTSPVFGGFGGAGLMFSTVGTHTITASYSGDSSFSSSVSIGTLVAVGGSAAGTTLGIQPSQQNPNVGQQVTLSIFVSPTGGGGTPSGAVSVTEGINVLATGSLDVNGTASFSVSLPIGVHQLTASYLPDNPAFGPSSSSTTVTVIPVATSLGLASSQNPAAAGVPVTFTATLRALTGNITPQGSVTFSNNGRTFGSACHNF